MTTFVKDPAAHLDFTVDWSAWLSALETISTTTVTVTPTGLTAETPTAAAGKVTVWLSGGSDGVRYTVTCQITTNAGRIDERSFYVDCQNR